ncbi:MAG: TSUP family transporter, partial [Phycisphaerales bacterium]
TFLAGFRIGVLTGTLGVGGGFLLVPARAVYDGLPMRRAVGTSVVVIVMNASAGLLGQWWSGGLAQVAFDERAVAITGICAMATVLGKMPWNRTSGGTAAAPAAKTCTTSGSGCGCG